MARLFADENFPMPVVDELRRLGHDVVTMHELDRSGRSVPDDVVLDLAAASGRAVLTLNRKHFIRLHVSGRGHAGIVVCTFDLEFAAQAGRIHAEVARPIDLSSQLLRINRPSR